MKKRQLAVMVSIATSINLVYAQDYSQPEAIDRIIVEPKSRPSVNAVDQPAVTNPVNTNTNNTLNSESQPIRNEPINSQPSVQDNINNIVNEIDSNAQEIEEKDNQKLDELNQKIIAEEQKAQGQISESANQVESQPVVAEPVLEELVDTIRAVETAQPSQAITDAVNETQQADLPVASEVTNETPQSKSVIAKERDIPEGITLINEDDDFVVERGLLGDSRRKEIELYEAQAEAQRCLGLIGVPGDVRMTENQIRQQDLVLEADELEFPDENTIILKGEAVAGQGSQQISGERLRYSKNDNILRGEGNVDLYSPQGDHMKTSNIELDMDVFNGNIGEVEYQMAQRDITPKLSGNVFVHARGKADGGQFLGHDLMKFNNATYTICPTGNDDVVLSAGEIELDYSNNTGTARNAVMRFLGVPIFYLPYFNFPITKERKSGLLAAQFGSDRDEGLFFATPVYWNIHPQVDATITPWYFTERGVMLEGEFRYLTEKSEGVLRAAYMPSDDLYEGSDNDDRGAITFINQTDFTDKLEGAVDFQYASDEDYYDDFSTNLALSSSSFLPQKGELTYFDRHFSIDAGVTSYFSVNDNISEFNEPYERLPHVDLNSELDGPLGINYGFDGSFNYFRHSERVDGTRYIAKPFVSYPVEEVYGYIEPKFALQYIGYNLSEGVDDGDNEDPYVYSTITSVDSKITFEREFDWGGDEHIQTLEPRVKYVYIPDEDQSAIPDFDTSERNVNNFSSIWEENRFFGGDRIGDTNQITVGLESRFLNNGSGQERASVSVGQVYFFEDREVSLDPNDESLDDSESDLLGEASLQLYNDWEVSGYTAWDTDENETRVRRATLSYNRDDSLVPGQTYLNVGYFFTRGANSGPDSEQLSAEAGYAINKSWSLFGRTIYDIDDSDSRYTNAGIRYDACCWSLSVLGEQSIGNDRDEEERVFVMFSLNGITELDYDYGGN